MLLVSCLSDARTVEEVRTSIRLFVSLADDQRDYDVIENIAREVLSVSSLYENETIALVYLLLAQKAENVGEFSKSYQFSAKGLGFPNLSKETQIALLLQSANSNYNRGKFKLVKLQANQVLELSNGQLNTKQAIHAMAYRAMANALLGYYVQGMHDLDVVTNRIETYVEYSEYLDILETLAVANSYLGDYQTALTLQEKLINLRFKLDKTANIERSFHNLAIVYEKMARFDDAYTWYLAAKNSAEQKKAIVWVAQAELGLGKVLLAQEQYKKAYESLEKAERIFKGQNLNNQYLSTLINLARAALALDNKKRAYRLLEQAVTLVELTTLTNQQLELYKLLASMYAEKQNYLLAFQMLEQYSSKKERFYQYEFSILLKQERTKLVTEQSRQLALNLADKTDLEKKYLDQVERLGWTVNILVIVLILTFAALACQWFLIKRKKAMLLQQLNGGFNNVLPTSEITRQCYQREFKTARQFNYPISVALLKIANWQELHMQFDKKTLNSVLQDLTQIIGDNIGDYDKVGILSDNELLVIFPHCDPEAVSQVLQEIKSELSLHLFANIGECAVYLAVECQTPDIQDIDPYIFLSKMSDSLNNNGSNKT